MKRIPLAACLMLNMVALSLAESPSSVSPMPQVPVLLSGSEQKTRAAGSLIAQMEKDKQKISVDFRGMDILSVLKILSQKGGVPIIAGKDVKGVVNVYLENVDVVSALQMILDANDLAYEEESGFLKVIPSQDYEKKYGKKFLDMRQTKVIPLKYVKAEDMLPVLNQVKSSSGQLIQNAKANSIVVIDLPDIIQRMERIVAETDQKEKQVLIEAKIVQLMLNDQYKIGVNWSQVFNQMGGVSGSSGSLDLKLGDTVEKGAMGVRAGIQVGTVGGANYSALLSALQTVGKTNLLSSPHISVVNNKEARILVGTKEAYVTTTVVTSGTGVSTTAEAVNFIDVGVKLFVTPTISRDGFVTLKIRPEVSSVYSTLTTASGNKIPLVRTSETETTITAKDGVTVIIAGLIENKDTNTRNTVPFLGKIPVIGYLFGGVSNEKAKTELVILMTPRIISGDKDIAELPGSSELKVNAK